MSLRDRRCTIVPMVSEIQLDGTPNTNILNARIFAHLSQEEIQVAHYENRSILGGELVDYEYSTRLATDYFRGYHYIPGRSSFGSCYPSAVVAAWDAISPYTVPEILLPPYYYITQFNHAVNNRSEFTGGQRFSKHYHGKQFDIRDRLQIVSESELETHFRSLEQHEALLVFLSLHFPEQRGADGIDGDRDTHIMFCRQFDESRALLVGDVAPFGGFMPHYYNYDLDVLSNNALLVDKERLVVALQQTIDMPTTTPYGRMLANTNLHRGKQIGKVEKNCSIVRFNQQLFMDEE